jgi:NAD/NADP transhydrogenase beta subunit
MLIWLINIYAGLSTAVAGFVLNNTELVVIGLLLVMSGSALANLIAKVIESLPVGVARLL